MFILFGLISMIVALLADYFLMVLLDVSFNSFNLWFIIPIGGGVVGALCGLGIFLYLKKMNIKASAKHFIASGLIAFIGFWSINYFTYASTYIDNGKVNNTFKGEHISNFMYNDTESFTFGNYLNYRFENAESVMTFIAIKTGDPVKFGKGYNKTSFYISMLGFILGGLSIGLIVLGDKAYCDKCKKYMLERKLYDFTYSDWDDEVIGLQNALQVTKEEFNIFVKRERVMPSNPEPYIRVVLTHCPVCKDAFITLKFMQAKKDSSGKITWEENKQYNRKLELANEISSVII